MVLEPWEEGATEHARRHGADVEDDDAQNGQPATTRDLPAVFRRDKPREQLGRAEKGQPDTGEAQHAHPACDAQAESAHRLEQRRVLGAQRSHRLGPATRCRQSDDGQRQEAAEHQDALEQVAVGHGAKAADRGVEEDDGGAHQDAGSVVEAEEGMERLTRCGQLGSGVGAGHRQNDDDAEQPQKVTRMSCRVSKA